MEEYLKALYNNFGGEQKIGKYEDYYNLMVTNSDYRNNFYNEFGGEKIIGPKQEYEELILGDIKNKIDEKTSLINIESIGDKLGRFITDIGTGGSQLAFGTADLIVAGDDRKNIEKKKFPSIGRSGSDINYSDYEFDDKAVKENLKKTEKKRKELFKTSVEVTKTIQDAFSEDGKNLGFNIPLVKHKFDDNLTSKVFSGLGNLTAFFATGWLTGYLGVGAKLSAGLSGAFMEGQSYAEQMYQMALDEGKSEEEAYNIAQNQARPIGLGLGSLEAFGIEGIAPGKLMKAGKEVLEEGIDKGGKSLLRDTIRSINTNFRKSLSGKMERQLNWTLHTLLPTMGKEAIQEAGQEAVQTFGEEVAQDQLLGKPIDWHRVLTNTGEAALIAGILGGGVSGLTTVVSKPSEKKIKKLTDEYTQRILDAIGQANVDKLMESMGKTVSEAIKIELQNNKEDLYATHFFTALINHSAGTLSKEDNERIDRILKNAGVSLNELSRILYKGALVTESVLPDLQGQIIDGKGNIFGIPIAELNTLQDRIIKILPKSYTNKIKKAIKESTGKKQIDKESLMDAVFSLTLSNTTASDKQEVKEHNYKVSKIAAKYQFKNAEQFNNFLKLKDRETVFLSLYNAIKPYSAAIAEKFYIKQTSQIKAAVATKIKTFNSKNPLKSKWKDINSDYNDEVLWYLYNNIVDKEKKNVLKEILEARGFDTTEVKKAPESTAEQKTAPTKPPDSPVKPPNPPAKPSGPPVKPATPSAKSSGPSVNTEQKPVKTDKKIEDKTPEASLFPEGTVIEEDDNQQNLDLDELYNDFSATTKSEEGKGKPSVKVEKTTVKEEPTSDEDVVDKYGAIDANSSEDTSTVSPFKGTSTVKEMSNILGKYKGKSKLINEIYDLAADVDVVFVTDDNEILRLGLNDKYGLYQNGKIYIRATADIDAELLQRIILHEAIHYVTVDAIDKNPKLQAELETIMNDLKKVMEGQALSDDEKKEVEYYLSSTKELVAGVLSDTTFISNFLDKVQYSSELTWRERILNFFKKVILGKTGMTGSINAQQQIDKILKGRLSKPTEAKTAKNYMPDFNKKLNAGEVSSATVATQESFENTDNKELDLYQAVNSHDEAEILVGLKSITNGFAEVFGYKIAEGQAPQEFLQTITWEEFNSFRQALSGEQITSDLGIADANALRRFVNGMKLGYQQTKKFHKGLSYNQYVKNTLLTVWNNAQSEVYYETLNVHIDKNKFIHLETMDGYFYDPTGKVKTNYRKRLKVLENLDGLKAILGDDNLSVSIINSFLEEKSNNVALKNIDDAKINIEELQIALSKEGYIFVNKYGDKATLTAIKTSKTLEELLSVINPIYQNYLAQVEAYIKENAVKGYGVYEAESMEGMVANTVRIILDELRVGNSIENIQNGNFVNIKMNFAETMKRSFNGSDVTYWEQDPSVLDEIEMLNDEGQTEKLKRIKKDSNGNYTSDEDIFIDDDTNEVIISTAFLSEEVTPDKLGINDLGVPIFDGASIYIIGRLNNAYKGLSGSVNPGHIKNWVGHISQILGKAVYIKHAKHGISFRDSIGKYLLKNKIGMLTSVTAEKLKSVPPEMQVSLEDLQNGNAKNKRIYIPLRDFNRIKETKEVKTLVKGFGQFFVSASRANPMLSEADINEVWNSIINNFVKAIQNFYERKSINDFTKDHLLNKIKSFGVYADNKHSKALFDLIERVISVTPKERLSEEIGNLLHHPYYSKYVNDLINKSIVNLLKEEMPGGMPVISPDFGDLASSRVDKVKITVKEHILENPEILEESRVADLAEYLRRIGMPPPDLNTLLNILKIPNSLANAKALLGKYEYALEYKLDIDDTLLSDETIAEYNEKVKEIQRDITELEKRYNDNKVVLNAIKQSQYIKDLQTKMLSQILNANGRLKWGYAMSDKSTAKRLGIRPFGKIISSVTPADSLASVMGHTVVAILDSDQIEDGSIVLNSEYIQLQGKDYDIDVVSIITRDMLNGKDFDNFWDIVSKIPLNYVDSLYKKYVSKGLVPEGAETFEEKAMVVSAKDKEGITPHIKYLQGIFGNRTDSNTYKFRPLGKEAGKLGDIYFKDVGFISTIRSYQGIMSSLGITSVVNKTFINVNKYYEGAHLAFQRITNNEVDFPKDTSKFFYNNDKNGVVALLLGNHPLNHDFITIELIQNVNKRLFDDIIQLPRERKREGLPETVKRINRAKKIINLLQTSKTELAAMIDKEYQETIDKLRNEKRVVTIEAEESEFIDYDGGEDNTERTYQPYYKRIQELEFERQIASTYIKNMKFFGKDVVENIDNALLLNIQNMNLDHLVPLFGVEKEVFDTIEIENSINIVRGLPIEMQRNVARSVKNLKLSYLNNRNLLAVKSFINALYLESTDKTGFAHLGYLREYLTEIMKPRIEIKKSIPGTPPIIENIRAHTYPVILKEVFKSPILMKSRHKYHETDIPYLMNLGYNNIEGDTKDFKVNINGKVYTTQFVHKNGVLYYKDQPIYKLTPEDQRYKIITESLWKDPVYGRANRLQISRMINMMDKSVFNNDKRLEVTTKLLNELITDGVITKDQLTLVFASLVVNPMAGAKVQSFHKGTNDSNSMLLMLAKNVLPEYIDNYIKSFNDVYAQVSVKDKGDESYGMPVFKSSKRSQTNLSVNIVNDNLDIEGSISDLITFSKLIDKSIPEAINFLQRYAGTLKLDMLKSMGMIGDRHLKYIFDIIENTNAGELNYRLKLNLDNLLLKNNTRVSKDIADTTIKENLLSLFFVINKTINFIQKTNAGYSSVALAGYKYFLTPEAFALAHGLKDKTRYTTMDRLLPNFMEDDEEFVKAKNIAETSQPFANRGTSEVFGDIEEEFYIEQKLEEATQAVNNQLISLHSQAQKYHDDVLKLYENKAIAEESTTFVGRQIQEEIFNFIEYGFKNSEFGNISIWRRPDGEYQYIIEGIPFGIESIGEYYYPIEKNSAGIDINEKNRKIFTAALSYRTLFNYEIPKVIERAKGYIDHIVTKIGGLNNAVLYNKAVKIQEQYAKILQAINANSQNTERDYVPHTFPKDEFQIDFYKTHYEKYRQIAIEFLKNKGYEASAKTINLFTQKILDDELRKILNNNISGSGLFNANWQMRVSHSKNYIKDDPRVYTDYIKNLINNLNSDLTAIGAFYYFAKAQKKNEDPKVIEYMKEHFASHSSNKFLHLQNHKKKNIKVKDEIEFFTKLFDRQSGLHVEVPIFGIVTEIKGDRLTVETLGKKVTVDINDIYTFDNNNNIIRTEVKKFRYADSVKYAEYLLAQAGIDDARFKKYFLTAYSKVFRFANSALGWSMLGGVVQAISAMNNMFGGAFTNLSYDINAYQLLPFSKMDSKRKEIGKIMASIIAKTSKDYSKLTEEEEAIYKGLKSLSINDLKITIDLITRGEYDVDEFGINWNKKTQTKDLWNAWRQKTGYDEYITEKRDILKQLALLPQGDPAAIPLLDRLQELNKSRQDYIRSILDDPKLKVNDELAVTRKEARSLLYKIIKSEFDEKSFSLFNKPEKDLRTIAFYLKYSEAIQLYGVSIQDAVEMGKVGTKDLHVIYSDKNRPSRSTTVIGKLLAKFAQYRVSRLVTQYREFRQALRQIYIYRMKALNILKPFIESSEKRSALTTSLELGRSNPTSRTANLEKNAVQSIAKSFALNLTLWHIDNVYLLGVMKFGSPFWTFFFEIIKTLLAAIDGKDDDDDFTLETTRGRIEAIQMIPFLGWGYSTLIGMGLAVGAGDSEDIPKDMLRSSTRFISQSGNVRDWLVGNDQTSLEKLSGIYFRSQKKNSVLDQTIPFYKNIKKIFK